MLVLAHLSDLHIATTPRLSDLTSKRGLGFINWQRKRNYPSPRGARRHHARCEALWRRPHCGDGRSGQPVAPRRIRAVANLARERLDPRDERHRRSGQSRHLCPHGAAAAENTWKDYMRGDYGAGARRISVPAAARTVRSDRALVSGATGPFMATGRLRRQATFDASHSHAATDKGMFRVVLIHHPPASRRGAICGGSPTPRRFAPCSPSTAPNC